MSNIEDIAQIVLDNVEENAERLLDFLDQRIYRIQFARVFAAENKISYSQAKKIYKQRYYEEAVVISKYAARWHVPRELIISLIEDDGLSFGEIDLDKVQEKIYQMYLEGNSKTKDLLLIKDYHGYTELMLKRVRNATIPPKKIPDVIDEIDSDISKYAKEHNVTKAVATLCVCNGVNITQAEKIVKFLTYNVKHNIESSQRLDIDFVKSLNANENFIKKTVHGITIISRTQERVDRLSKIVEDAFLYGKEEYKKQLEQLAKDNNLILTDIHYLEDENTATFFARINLIYMDLNCDDDLVDSFFHESSHFIDHIKGDGPDYYSMLEDRVLELFNKIAEKINTEPYASIINNPNIPRFLKTVVTKYATTINKGVTEKGKDYKRKNASGLAIGFVNDSAMVEKWKKEIQEQYAPETEKEARDYLLQKKRNKTEEYIYLIDHVYDIYDAIARGRLRDKYGTGGHGRDYYASPEKRLLEFIANIGVFYNNDSIDVLVYEFGEELAQELISIYKELLQKRNEMSETDQDTELNAMLAESTEEKAENNYTQKKVS